VKILWQMLAAGICIFANCTGADYGFAAMVDARRINVIECV
jgi:hypothetical protein